jgi:hypothetical protein
MIRLENSVNFLVIHFQTVKHWPENFDWYALLISYAIDETFLTWHEAWKTFECVLLIFLAIANCMFASHFPGSSKALLSKAHATFIPNISTNGNGRPICYDVCESSVFVGPSPYWKLISNCSSIAAPTLHLSAKSEAPSPTIKLCAKYPFPIPAHPSKPGSTPYEAPL